MLAPVEGMLRGCFEINFDIDFFVFFKCPELLHIKQLFLFYI
jgi:hypothetical protein